MSDLIERRYRLYAYQREQHLTAAGAARVFGPDAAGFEVRFQQEIAELAERLEMVGQAVGDVYREARAVRSHASRAPKRVLH